MVMCLQLMGCNSSQGGEAQDSVMDTATESTQNKQESDPAAQEAVDLIFLHGQDSFDPETDYTRELIRELLGVNIIPEMGNDDDKVNLILSSGQEYDMIKLINRNLLVNYIKNDAIYALDEYIDQYGENLKNAFTQEEWDMVSYEGKIYGIPETNTTDVEWGFAIREDWLAILGESMPETPDELYNVLKRFKEEDLGNVGKENVIPLTMEGEISFNGLAQAFGISEKIDGYIEKDGKLLPSLEQPGAKELVTYLNKLYKEGLLDADFPSNKNDGMISKVAAGIAGACKMTPWESAALKSLRESDSNATLSFLEPLKDADGNQAIVNRSGLKGFLIVPKSSTKVEEVIKYCNDFLDPANYTTLILGTENETYKMEDGKYMPILPGFDIMNKGRWFYPTNVGEMYTPLFSARAHKEDEMGELWDDINAKAGDNSYEYILNYSPTLPEIEELKQKLTEQTKEKIIKMIIDENELKNFDDFVAEWKSKGGDQLTEAYNEWYTNR